MTDNPMVTLNHAIAAAMVHGPPRAGLNCWRHWTRDERLAGHHRLDAVRAHLLEKAGDRGAPSRTTAPRPDGRRVFRAELPATQAARLRVSLASA